MLTRRKLLRASLAAPALILARHEIIRPVEAFSHGIVVPVPGPAQTWGYKTRTFFDDFTSLSTIDVNNTGGAGFNWYVRNSWPNAGLSGNGWGPFVNGNPTPSAAISISGSVLELTQTATNQGPNLQSCIPNGGSFIGHAFSNGFYIEWSVAMDSTLNNSSAEWPAMWSAPTNFLLGASNDIVELDYFELYTNDTTYMAIEEWTYSGGSLINDSGITNSVVSLGLPLTQLLSLNRFGTLWVPMSKNSGTGLFQRFFNGVHLPGSDVTYTATGPATPGMAENPNGALSVIDSQANELIISCGYNWPIYIDYVAVWQ